MPCKPLAVTYRETELPHARLTMLGNLECLTLELSTIYAGVALGWSVGFAAGSHTSCDSILGCHLVHKQSALAILVHQAVSMSADEAQNVNGGPLGEEVDLLHPSDALHFLQLATNFAIFGALSKGSMVGALSSAGYGWPLLQPVDGPFL